MINAYSKKIAIIGLGYVGLPLAVEFAKKFEVVGYDINELRIAELLSGHDQTLEVDPSEIRSSVNLVFTSDPVLLSASNFYVVTVPTPVDKNKRPDLSPLYLASQTIGRVLKVGDIVVYESTVYPGATEIECVPVLEKISGLKLNKDFYVGYSPERIVPGDKGRRLTEIKKITSASTAYAAEVVDAVYAAIINAGTHKAPSIKVAEAAKVIENTQRDVNIALMNELAMIFNKLGIDTQAVLEAAGTKWNFLPFRPGLVGGHCIGVDPYYLAHIAERIGYYPEIVLASRRINDGVGKYVAAQLIKTMVKADIQVNKAKILVMGLTFKENCPDLRNSRVIDIITELEEFGCVVDVFEPWVSHDEVQRVYSVNSIETPQTGLYDGVILAVAHRQFIELGSEKIREFGKSAHVLYDIKHLFSAAETDLRL